MITLAEFGKRLCFARLALGWTQRDLAAKSGVGQKAISTYENGRNEPGVLKAAALGAALGVSLDVLTGAYEEVPR